MRLINAQTRRLSEFMGDDNIPAYAILSHTWGCDEVTYQDINSPDSGLGKDGYTKIGYCCDQAIKDGLYWAWVDTCCIDKTSSAELSEAINSMFRWYQKAEVCYVYLADVWGHHPPIEDPREFAQSRWFTRCWTLQELIAPRFVIFYSRLWVNIGNKEDLTQIIMDISNIHESALYGASLELFSVARKMSWAAKRQSTRVEDIAYSLLGLFDVHMPLLYGEGSKAFIRLQEEILKSSYDHSLFAWRSGFASVFGLKDYISRLKLMSRTGFSSSDDSSPVGLLADSPVAFQKSYDVESIGSWGEIYSSPPIVHNKCVYIDLPVIRDEELDESFAILDCRFQRDDLNYLAVPLRQWGVGTFCGRLPSLIIVPIDLVKIDSKTLIPECTEKLRIKAPGLKKDLDGCFVLGELPLESTGYQLGRVHVKTGARYDRRSRILWPEKRANGAQAVFVFRNKDGNRFAIILAQDARTYRTRKSWAYVKRLEKGPFETEEELHGYLQEVDLSEGGWNKTDEGWVVVSPFDSASLQLLIVPQSSDGPTEFVNITKFVEKENDAFIEAGRIMKWDQFPPKRKLDEVDDLDHGIVLLE